MATSKQAAGKLRRLAAKEVRLGARISRSQKEVLQRAADLTGRSLSDFVIGSALEQAREAIRAYELLDLSERDARAFVAALQRPPDLDEKMAEAVRWHRRHVDVR